MDAWRDDFSARATGAGHDRALVKSLLDAIRPLPLWLGTEVQSATAPSAQAEFAKPIWEYLKVPMGKTRISSGQARLAALSPTLAAIEAEDHYGETVADGAGAMQRLAEEWYGTSEGLMLPAMRPWIGVVSWAPRRA